jgi:hypothetical protein
MGGTVGDEVPIDAVPILSALASSQLFADGQASLTIRDGAGTIIGAACAHSNPGRDGDCSALDEITVDVASGFLEQITMSVFASTGGLASPGPQAEFAEADPLITIDPSFPNAGEYSVEISPDVGNGLPATTVPEPGTFLLMAGLIVAAAGYRGIRGLVSLREQLIDSMKIPAAILVAALCANAQSTLPDLFPFPNATGLLQNHNTSSRPIPLTGAFFQSLGTNGRTCVTCHQPSAGFGVAAAEISLRFLLTQGKDPIFRTNDGSNCDQNIDVSTLEGRRKAFSLLTGRGLIRVTLSPPAGAVYCYGCPQSLRLHEHAKPRHLPQTAAGHQSSVPQYGDVGWPGVVNQTGTQKIGIATNPADLLADLAQQAIDATTGHAQGTVPSAAQVDDIVNFETSLTSAQSYDYFAGALNSDGATGGPSSIASLPFYIGINDPSGNDKAGT